MKKPQHGDNYWTMSFMRSGNPVFQDIWIGNSMDENRWKNKIVFDSEKDATKTYDKIFKVLNYIDVVGEDCAGNYKDEITIGWESDNYDNMTRQNIECRVNEYGDILVDIISVDFFGETQELTHLFYDKVDNSFYCRDVLSDHPFVIPLISSDLEDARKEAMQVTSNNLIVETVYYEILIDILEDAINKEKGGQNE